ncbi:MAG: META domain-containing protein [Treponema sp.]|nr:META domain-containing protein [Treponema sp.]
MEIKIAAVFILMVLAAQFCAASAMAQKAENIANIQGKDWILEQVNSGQASVRIDRAGSTADVYTIRFDADRISGAAAPNRYFGPYTAGDGLAVSFGMIGSTMMAALFERTDLREQDYFNYLQKAYRWNLSSEKLELYTLDADGNEAVLVYSLK